MRSPAPSVLLIVPIDLLSVFSQSFGIKAWVPTVSAAALGVEGQLTTIDPRIGEPCYACLIPDVPEVEPTCAETGVLGPVVGTLGTLQAVEVLGVLLAGLTACWTVDAVQCKDDGVEVLPLPKGPRLPSVWISLRVLRSKFDLQPVGWLSPVTFSSLGRRRIRAFCPFSRLGLRGS